MTDSAKAETGLGPRAIRRVLRLFEILAAVPEGLSLSDLSARLNEPKSTLLNSLRPLEADGFLNTEGTLYRLGPRAFRLGSQISSGWALMRLMRGYLLELANRAHETALLSVLDPTLHRSVHIDVIESAHRVRYVIAIGSGGPLYATASGRVLLAFQSQLYQEDYLSRVALKPVTPRTTTSIEELRRQLEQVRHERIWVSRGEVHAEGGAIAAPVFGPRGDLVAAISVALPLSRLHLRETALREMVSDVAARASGHPPSFLAQVSVERAGAWDEIDPR